MNGTGNLGPLQRPDLRALLDLNNANLSSEVNCAEVGSIVAFDATIPTVQVQLVLKRAVFNNPQGGDDPSSPTLIDYPVLVDVPLFVNQGGGAVLTMPIAIGDSCLVVFNDRDLDPWWTTGTIGSPPNSNRMHSLADAIAFVGIRSRARPISAYSTVKAQLRNNGGIVSVDAKIGIANASTSLKLVIDQLCSALTAWVDTHGDTPSAGTLAAIAAVKTLSDSLLE